MSDTKKYKVLRPIGFKGDRVEKDAIVELTDEEAQNIGPDVELVDAHTEQIDTSKEESTSESGSPASNTDEGAVGSFENESAESETPAGGEGGNKEEAQANL